MGDSRTKKGTVCFRTALSSGDRSTLALAFFLARLKRDPDLGKKLVVFDDPLSSLDCFRASYTQQEIRRIADKAAQVIVLSHDASFLNSINDEEQTAKTLHITGRGDSHHIKNWDIAHHCRSQSDRDYFLLKRFLEEGGPPGSDLSGVARRVRPYVEDHLRRRYPDQFGGLTLGKCIEKIDGAQEGTAIVALKTQLADLRDINEFARASTHADQAPGPPSETELKAYVRRAITFVQGA